MLAESENVSVFHCSCGNIHLQVGAVCLTMQPEELQELGGVVLSALSRCQSPSLQTSVVN